VPTNEFELEQRRQRVAHSLPPQCAEDFLRLSRSLLHGPMFQWLLVDAPHEGLRHQVMAALDDVLRSAGLHTNSLPLSGRIQDVPELEARLIKNAGEAQVVHVIGRPGWFTAARWDAFNARRERLAQQARARLVFWLDEEAIELASRGAPDLWAWRAGVYGFKTVAPEQAVAASEARLALAPRPKGPDTRSMGQRLARRAAIQAWLQAHPGAPDDLLVGPLSELGRLFYDAGDFDEALAHWHEQELPLHRRRGDERAVAITQGNIADVLLVRGQLDDALRIRQEEELPVYQRLGDVHALAVTQGQIADVLQARGQLEEALRIRREEQLPVFERLGDVRAVAVTQGQIADVLQSRGQLDEALRIRREEQLPVFERLGDVHARAITQGQIADVLHARGQLDEALRIRREEQLPVYEKLGDVRARAMTQGQIADVLQARGQLDEALRIRREEELPVYEKLGDVHALAITQGQIAHVLQARGQLDEALRIRREEQLPVFEKLGDVRARAVTQGQIADLLQARGELDEALRIRREEQLPVFEKLGDVRSRAVTQWKLALQLLGQVPPQRDEAQALLGAAYATLAGMGMPEAQSMLRQAQQFGLTLPNIPPHAGN
jgi:tetratricopeptide (TPR) repeat protein